MDLIYNDTRHTAVLSSYGVSTGLPCIGTDTSEGMQSQVRRRRLGNDTRQHISFHTLGTLLGFGIGSSKIGCTLQNVEVVERQPR